MQLSLQNFSTLVGNMAASAQGACATLLDVSVGSVLRATLEASASVALWLQYLILQVLSMTRLATSIGSDVDSWVADYGLGRLPPVAAEGSVVMMSFSPSAQPATIPTGALVKTGDGSQSFVVVGGPYTRLQGIPSIVVSIEASTPGTAGNVQAGVITILGTAIPGIDTVMNPDPLTGGLAAETDQALRLRFITYLNTRSQATEQAVANAIVSVQQGLSYVIQENLTAAGVALPGHFNVIVDDGSGNPPDALLAAVFNAIDLIRPLGSSFSVSRPTLLIATVAISLSTADAALFSQTQSAISAALAAYINALAVGQVLRYSRLAGLAYDASSDVTNVVSVSLNGASSDLGGAAASVVRVGTVSVVEV
ncbi:baseplate J/gp47 family protein [Lichenicoccus sp.]|uniref:baseplate J/gp47 family protein n=1 Tax=Lichenicoccus sp. TaxID=2781899 RepID=UPI003D1485C8